MKALTTLAVGSVLVPAAVMLAPDAQAAEILPYIYADEFCSLSKAGYSRNDSIKGAVAASIIHSAPDPVRITRPDGSTVGVDVVRATRVAHEQCPWAF